MECVLKLREDHQEALLDALPDSPDIKQLKAAVQKGQLAVDDVKKIKDLKLSNSPPVHILFRHGQIILPEVKKPERNPELVKRIERLKREQEMKEYSQMIGNLSTGTTQLGHEGPREETIGEELKSVNRQLTVVLNMVLTVVGGFFFGFKASEFVIPGAEKEVAFQYMGGLIMATVIMFADIYFIVKNDV